MDDRRDVSLWHSEGSAYSTGEINGWYTYMVYQAENGLWYWQEIHHDGWDGEELFDEITAQSEPVFPSWQDAALDCQEHNDM